MKRLLAGAAIAVCALGMTSRAEAMEVFVEGALGAALDSDVDVDGGSETAQGGPAGFVAIGLADVIGNVDVRLEYMTTDRDYENSFFAQQQTSAIMLNATVDAPVGPFELYGGGGVGIIEVEFHGMPGFYSGVDGGESVFGWQIVGGARIPILSTPFSAFAEGRYQAASDATIDGIDVEYNSLSVVGGVRWTF
jgi:opacity protein-like surface antigen